MRAFYALCFLARLAHTFFGPAVSIMLAFRFAAFFQARNQIFAVSAVLCAALTTLILPFAFRTVPRAILAFRQSIRFPVALALANAVFRVVIINILAVAHDVNVLTVIADDELARLTFRCALGRITEPAVINILLILVQLIKSCHQSIVIRSENFTPLRDIVDFGSGNDTILFMIRRNTTAFMIFTFLGNSLALIKTALARPCRALNIPAFFPRAFALCVMTFFIDGPTFLAPTLIIVLDLAFTVSTFFYHILPF